MKSLGASRIGWTAVLTTLGFGLGLAAVGEGNLITLGFTPLAVVIGLILFQRYPRQYAFYATALWMFTPLVRRLADWLSGYNVANPVMLAPLLVSSLGVITVIRRAGRIGTPNLLPFTIIAGFLGFAFLLGLMQNGVASAAVGLLNWGGPLLFAMHLLLRHRQGEEYEGAVLDALAWGTLALGLYGIYQYFAPPIWDRYWMMSSGMTSIGSPAPRMVRVFGTMNSPGPFADMLVIGLLALLVRGGAMRWIASAPGYTALLLSLVRAAWGGWFLGALALIITSPPKRSMNYLAIGGALAVLSMPLLLLEPVSSVVSQRMNTLNSADQDVSLRARLELYRNSSSAAQSLLGSGLGQSGSATRLAKDSGGAGDYTVIDSGLVELLMTFGLPGAAVIVVALMTSLTRAGMRARSHPNAGLGFAMAFATFVQIAFGPMLSGVSGAIFYTSLALALSPRERRVAPTQALGAQARTRLLPRPTG